MGRREDPAWSRGTVGLTTARQRGDGHRQFRGRMMFTRSLIDRLGLEQELNGHLGCVNCLEWNRDGSILASASDDFHMALWDPFKYKLLHNIPTGHTGNIFSVKFVAPDTLATGAADGTVRVREVSGRSLLECSCHCGRVKRLAVSPDTPQLFWSCAEDGLILQHDLRIPHRCNTSSRNVLVNLMNHLGRYAEAKCVAVNPRRAHELAVGANDFYVRLYDTRMIKLAVLETGSASGSSSRLSWERQNLRCARAGHGDPDENIPRGAVHYYAPGHLHMEPDEQNAFPKKTTTYVAFSDDGSQLLVNMGSEQVYLFDINSCRRPVLVESFIISYNHCAPEAFRGIRANGTNNGANGTNGTIENVVLPPHVMKIKDAANECVNKGLYSAAVELYNAALEQSSPSALLLSNRAAALMRRGWAGDTYSAIKDCYTAIRLDSNHVKSHFRLAKGLMDMKRAREAHEVLLYFKDRFPRHASSHAVFLLQKDINVALEKIDSLPDESTRPHEPGDTLSELERQLQAAAADHSQRYLGHCNTTTDIKEANFLGPNGDYIAAGSDDGSMFIWCRRSGNIVRALRGDESIVNCVQPHPDTFLIATSGIESTIRLWSPRPEDGSAEARVVRDPGGAAAANQRRMRSDPFEAMLLNISFAGAGAEPAAPHSPACRAS